MNNLVAIVGPTGTGKTRLAIRLAQAFNGEIVSADSRQVYRYMDIGTAKPSAEELSRVPHHLINIINPDEDFSLSQYQYLAYKAINDIQQRSQLPLLVGGSGLYVWSLLEGWSIPRVPPDAEFRRSLQIKAAQLGSEELYKDLVKVDPVAAQEIDPRNVRRVIRALEVLKYTGTPFSQLRQKKPPSFSTLIIGLTADRAELYRHIDRRVDEMIERGLIDEVKKLVDMGNGLDLPSMSGIGYKQIGQFLKGDLSLESAVLQVKHETHRFVRHQYSWFRLRDSRIKWFDIQKEVEPEVTALVAAFISD
jgi:tRNA dimethylallyltransferase